MVEHVRLCSYKRHGRLSASRCIVEAVQVNLPALDPRVDRSCAVHPTLIGRFYWWQLYAPHEPDDVGSGQPTRDHPGEVTRLFQAKDQGNDIPASTASGGH